MRKILMVLGFVFMFVFVLSFSAFAEGNGMPFENEEKEDVLKVQLIPSHTEGLSPGVCPETNLTGDVHECTFCHAMNSDGKFVIKEFDLDSVLNYPNGRTKIRQVNGQKVGFFSYDSMVDDETCDLLEDSLFYFDRHKVDKIVINIFSGGGSIFAGWKTKALMDQFKAKGYIIETHVRGFAASAAFVIFANGSQGHRVAAKHSELMWHELWTFKMLSLDTPSSSEEESRVLRHLQDNMRNFLASVSNMSKEELENSVKNGKELWITGKEAMEQGFVDKIY